MSSEVTVSGVKYVRGAPNPAAKIPCGGCAAGDPHSGVRCHDLGYDCLRTRGVYWIKAEQQTEKEEK